jgi:arsenate reductase (thioredoxin)
MRNVLFVCVHNSARSQMAQAFVNRLGAGVWQAESAGLSLGSGGLNPQVVVVMAEKGYDLSGHYPKSLESVLSGGCRFDLTVTVCDESQAEACPYVPGARQHWGFPDPASFKGTPGEILEAVRKVRDEIEIRVRQWLAEEGLKG